MGSGMARTLARRGYRVKVYNRTRSRADAVHGPGIVVTGSPAEAVDGATAVICMLSEVTVLRSLLATGGLGAALRSGTYLIDASTSGPSDSRVVAAQLREAGVTMLDAPVFGSKDAAEAGALTFVVGGERAAYDACLPLFDAMGTTAFYVGTNGSGCLAKLGFNLVLAGTLQAFSEAIVLTRAGGVDPKQMYDIIMAGRARSGIIEMKGPRMLEGDFTPFFPLKHMAKDLRLMTEAAEALGLTLPLTALVRAAYDTAVASGLGESDFCHIIQSLDRAPVPRHPNPSV